MESVANVTAEHSTNPVSVYQTLFQRFEKQLAGRGSAMVAHKLRKEGLDAFTQSGFPTGKLEAWRQTSVSSLLGLEPQLAEPIGEIDSTTRQWLESELFPITDAWRMVFVDGQFESSLSTDLPDVSGVTLRPLADALESGDANLAKALGQIAPTAGADNSFNALNSAFILNGTWLSIDAGVTLEKPVVIVYASLKHDQPTFLPVRNVISVGEGATGSIVEHFIGQPGGQYFTNVVSEIQIGATANFDHYRIQSESPESDHIAGQYLAMGREARYASQAVTLGGRLSRHWIEAHLNGEHIDCTLNGLNIGTNGQMIDTHTLIDHRQPHCNSHELYKGIWSKKARGLFCGKLYVHPIAQKTDAKQTNRNLLLDDTAIAYAQPQLEIYADDVKCTHGATLGQLDDEAMFYLRARGLSHEAASELLMKAYAIDILERIEIAPVAQGLKRRLFPTLEGSS